MIHVDGRLAWRYQYPSEEEGKNYPDIDRKVAHASRICSVDSKLHGD